MPILQGFSIIYFISTKKNIIIQVVNMLCILTKLIHVVLFFSNGAVITQKRHIVPRYLAL